ncbi:MAG TPA: glycine zipper family protein [Gammaproteobacteria bacterium]|nr:glycine zipper family protein [Gammaproteobacteria bacterium]
MRTQLLFAAAALALSTLPRAGAAAEGKLMIYPAKGQSDKQLGDDRYACYVEAVQQSGFDPAKPPAAVPATPITVKVPENPRKGATGTGTAVGALAGAAVGNNNHDTLGGAIAGAIIGSAIGGAVAAKGQAEAREEAEQKAKQAAAGRADERTKLAQSRAAYRAAMRACLEGRGYVVR